jgi:UPF0755 protein
MPIVINGANGDGATEELSREYLIERGKHKLVVFVISLLIVLCICSTVATVVNWALFEPASFFDNSNIEVTIEKSSSVSTIAQTLYDKGLIRSKTVFQLMVAFYNQGASLKAGDYIFQKTMTPREIMYKLAAGESMQDVLTFTSIEGYTMEDEANSLAKTKVIPNTDTFLSIARDGADFLDYGFISAIPEASRAKRKYLLEGYVFPDTYEIYVGASEATIISKQLAQFNKVFTNDYYARAEELDMTVDQVVTLASIIQEEAKPADFRKVSAVLHNRLDKGMKLESCATVQYALGIKRFNLTSTDIHSDSPYNTYRYAGYPAGPICNPGKDAIEAALYPDEDYLKGGYKYFCNKDPKDGELVFSKTLDEHQQNVEKYRPLWEAYDTEHGY